MERLSAVKFSGQVKGLKVEIESYTPAGGCQLPFSGDILIPPHRIAPMLFVFENINPSFAYRSKSVAFKLISLYPEKPIYLLRFSNKSENSCCVHPVTPKSLPSTLNSLFSALSSIPVLPLPPLPPSLPHPVTIYNSSTLIYHSSQTILTPPLTSKLLSLLDRILLSPHHPHSLPPFSFDPSTQTIYFKKSTPLPLLYAKLLRYLNQPPAP